jgi:hypothetical protein
MATQWRGWNGEGGPEPGALGAGRSGWEGGHTAALVGGRYAVRLAAAAEPASE